MFCQQYTVQQEFFKNGQRINQCHTHIDFVHTLPKPKMPPFNSLYLTENYHSKDGKTHMSYQWRHLMFIKWKYIAREKIDVKVDRFLKFSGRFQI